MIPSTFGKGESFLDMLQQQTKKQVFLNVPFADLREPHRHGPLPLMQLQGVREEDLHTRCVQQTKVFSQQEEFGLLNRLDNDTSGFLYFANNTQAHAQYKTLQKEGKIFKKYLAQVQGKVDLSADNRHLDSPIMHHKSIPEKMLVIQNPQDIRLGRGKQHHVNTDIELTHYDPETDVSTLLVTIQRGVRHQIRAHLASKGYPIIGDSLYGKKSSVLCLWSLGFSIIS